MTWFVARNTNGSIASLNRNHMDGYNDEQIADTDPTVIAFLNPVMPDLAKFDLYDRFTLFLLVELVSDLLAKGTIAASDFSATTRTVYTRAKALLVTAEALLPPPP